MELGEIRGQIDNINTELVKLFVKRMQLSAEVSACKEREGLPVYDKGREREVLAKVSEQAGEPFEGYTRVLFSTLFDLSRSYQQSLRAGETALTKAIRDASLEADVLFPEKGTVACQGVEGAYSQHACDKLFAVPSILYFKSFEGVFQAVESGLCQFGVLPIENSSYGSVGSVYDLMKRYRFSIVRSLRLHVSHSLLAKPGTKISDIKEIYSHEQAIGQCSGFLAKLGSSVKVTVCENTAAAAKMVAESGRQDIAAISSKDCAKLYGLESVANQVQDSGNNYTRFICIQKEMKIYPGSNRISLMFALSHEPGSLYRMIARFAALGLNLVKLESRPVPGSDFEFLFYADLEASVYSSHVMELLGELSKGNEEFTFLGCYSEV